MLSTFCQDYLHHLKDDLKVIDLGSYHEITLPFFDRIGDQLSVYVEENDGSYRISDDGYIYNNLLNFGFKPSKKRNELIELICQQTGISFDDGELYVTARSSNLASQVHTLAMGMLRIDDMDLVKTTRVASLFSEDVKKTFDRHDLNYTEDFMFRGKSGFSQSFDFFFQKNNKRDKDIVCKVINNPNKSTMESAIFSWEDIVDKRGSNTVFVVVMNDEKRINTDIVNGFKQYSIQPLPFSELDSKIGIFA